MIPRRKTSTEGLIRGKRRSPTAAQGSRPRLYGVTFAFCALLMLPSFPALAGILDPAEAVTVESIIPVLNEDVSLAHRQALEIGFRRAVAAALRDVPVARGGQETGAPENPEKYVAAYRILEQVRKDLFYRLKILVWVDRRLLGRAVGKATR